MELIKNQISQVFKQLSGDFVVPKNAYEKRFCDLLGWYTFDSRYYDAFNGETFIEIKKGQAGMYFDMVRYSEIVMNFGTQNTVTVFFKWSKKYSRVEEAMIIDTEKIIEFLKIDRAFAKTYLKIYRHVPRGVNILASATAKDLREMATFVIKRKPPLVVPLKKPKLTIKLRHVSEYGTTTDSTQWPVINVYITYKNTGTNNKDAVYWEKSEDIPT
jgi:hypothetical protein